MRYLQSNWRSFLVLSLLLGLAIYFRAFLAAAIIEPIALLFWAVWRVIAAVHQGIYWAILILVCSILLFRFFPFKRRTSGRAYDNDYCPANRVESWLTWIRIASLGTEEAEYLRDGLRRLLTAIQRSEEFPSSQPGETLTPDMASPPPAVRRFLFPTREKHRLLFGGDYRTQMLFWMPKWFRRWAGKAFQVDNTAIEETLTWMESLMEIRNDESTPDGSID